VLDLGREAAARLVGDQLVLERLPVDGVVDVPGRVEVGAAEEPGAARRAGGRLGGVAQPGARPPAHRGRRVDGVEALRQRLRAAPVGLEVDPQRDGLDRDRASAAHDAAALGPERRRPAAERRDLELVEQPREPAHRQREPAHDPHAGVVEPGVARVVVGGVLEPARDGVEPRAAARRDVAELDAIEVPVDAPGGRKADGDSGLHAGQPTLRGYTLARVRNPDAERFVGEIWDAFQREGVAGVLAYAADDTVWQPHSAGKRTFNSTAEYREYAERAPSDERLEALATAIWSHADVVVVRGRMRIRRVGGLLEDTRMYWLFAIAGERLVRMGSSPDLAGLLREAGHQDPVLAREAFIALHRAGARIGPRA
jgi:hypothetical protein